MAADALAVLTYHRIGDRADGPPGLISATPQVFERQMRWLGASGRAVAVSDVLAARAGGAPLRANAVLVTFDDAYADFATLAWPVLRRHGVPVTLFVPTAYPSSGRAFWWDRLHVAIGAAVEPLATPLGPLDLDTPERRTKAYRALRDHVKTLPHAEAMALVDELVARLDGPEPAARVLDWELLRALAGRGVTLAPHSRTHPRLDRLPPERLADEVAGSRAELEAETGAAAPVFAYPSGGVSDAAREAVRDAGLDLAFTTARGVAGSDLADPYAVPRLNVGRRTTLPLLRAQLSAPGLAAAAAGGRTAPLALTLRSGVSALRERRAGAPGSTDGERTPAGPVVAYTMSRFPKISETFILTEILELQERGLRVEVYPLLREREAIVHPEARALVERAHYLPALSPAILASQLYWLRRDPRAYLGTIRDIARATSGSANFFFGGLGIVPKVAHAARQMQADGVAHLHCHFASHPAVAGFIVQRLTGIPFSFTAHGSDLHVERRMLAEKVAEAAFVATVSELNRRLIIDACGGRFGDKVHVVRAGIDTRLFETHRNGGRGAGPLRVLSVGSLIEVKGQTHLIEACRLLAADGVEVSLRLVGDGADRDALARQAADGAIAEHVTFVGGLTRTEVAAELEAADVFVAASVPTAEGKREGIPVVLMEAMCSGLPVVASDLSGIPELVEDEIGGLLVAPRDSAGLARAIRRLHDDPALRGRLADRGRRRVLEEFDVRTSADALVERFALEGVAG